MNNSLVLKKIYHEIDHIIFISKEGYIVSVQTTLEILKDLLEKLLNSNEDLISVINNCQDYEHTREDFGYNNYTHIRKEVITELNKLRMQRDLNIIYNTITNLLEIIYHDSDSDSDSENSNQTDSENSDQTDSENSDQTDSENSD